jgi:hypothetical protein
LRNRGETSVCYQGSKDDTAKSVRRETGFRHAVQ